MQKDIYVLLLPHIPEEFTLACVSITTGDAGYAEWQEIDKHPRRKVLEWLEQLMDLNKIPFKKPIIQAFKLRAMACDN